MESKTGLLTFSISPFGAKNLGIGNHAEAAAWSSDLQVTCSAIF